MKPCDCNSPDCRLCWLAANDERYQKLWAKRKGTPTKSAPKPISGPGTELQKLLKSLGLKTSKTCGCAERAREMDRLGVAGCRERFTEIRQWLVEARGKTTWMETIHAAAAVVTGGLKIDPLDVEGSLLRIAIERAEA